jgi:hypothetical protein
LPEYVIAVQGPNFVRVSTAIARPDREKIRSRSPFASCTPFVDLDMTRQDRLHDFVRAGADALATRIGIGACDWILAHEAAAAVHLDAFVENRAVGRHVRLAAAHSPTGQLSEADGQTAADE